MEILGQLFNDDEIEEVELAKDFCKGMTVNGSEIVCFDVISDLLTQNKSILTLPRDLLLNVYTQLKGYNQFWSEVDWFDNEKLGAVLNKFKIIFNEVLKK